MLKIFFFNIICILPSLLVLLVLPISGLFPQNVLHLPILMSTEVWLAPFITLLSHAPIWVSQSTKCVNLWPILPIFTWLQLSEFSNISMVHFILGFFFNLVLFPFQPFLIRIGLVIPLTGALPLAIWCTLATILSPRVPRSKTPFHALPQNLSIAP